MEIPQKTKTRPRVQSSVTLPGYYLKKTKAPTQKGVCMPVFIVALFTAPR